MIWIKNLRSFAQLPKVTGGIPICSSPCYSVVNQQQKCVLRSERIPLVKQACIDKGSMDVSETLVSKFFLSWRPNGLYGSGVNSYCSKQYSVTLPGQFKHAIHTGPNMSRDFLVQLWVTDMKMKKDREKRRRPTLEYANNDETVGTKGYERQPNFEYVNNDKTIGTKGYERAFSRSSGVEERPYESSQPFIEPTEYSSPEEALIALAALLSRSNLLITRDIEWANLTIGFEQENRYAIVDVSNPYVPAGFIREQSNVLMRQFLRRRRPFIASITDGYGNELFRVRRPFWWITSSIYAEVGGKEVGVVHRRWHLWKRVYDLYLGNEQFAVVENPGFWYWTFTLKGINGEVLAEIDRDWRGFGFEIFTDAGQYVIRFGSSAHQPTSDPAGKVQELEVARPLTLLERAITVALAVSLDNDYFSRHGGWGLPFIAVTE